MLAIGFDFDHTLGVDNKLERAVLLELGEQHGIALGATRVDAALAAFRGGSVTLNEALRALFVGCDVESLITLFRERVVERAPAYVEAIAGAKSLCEALIAQNIPMAIFTNGWSPLQEKKAELIGFPGPVFVSENVGLRKPDPAAFQFLAQQLGVECVNLVYVGDDPRVDIAGAKAAGARGVWFDWEGRAYPSDIAEPDVTIHTLDDLANITVAPTNR